MVSKREVAAMRRQAALNQPGQAVVPETANNIIEFVTSARFLRQRLFPRQGTLLKVITLRDDLFTNYDRQVVSEWTSRLTIGSDEEGDLYQGDFGTPPDLMERMRWCREQRQQWASEVLLVIGRRGSKNWTMSVLMAWVLWQMLGHANPQEHYDLPPDKVIGFYVLGANLDQVLKNAFKDIVDILNNAPCFQPFLGKSTAHGITLLTQSQLAAGARPGVDEGSIRVIPAASTPNAVRGPAVAGLVLDEIAHVERGTASADSIEMYRSSRASLAQFPGDRIILQISSPWERTGQLYLSHQLALRVEDSGAPANPEIFAFQLPSPSLYDDAHKAPEIPMWPGGPSFGPPRVPKITWDTVDNELRRDPESAKVEYLANYGNVAHAYLPPGTVEAIFAPHNGVNLTIQGVGRLGTVYVAHADPSRVNANFGFAMAHLDVDANGFPHVVFDVLHAWRPSEFPNHTINYGVIEDELFGFIRRFNLAELTFDQFNSAGSIDRLRDRSVNAGLARQPAIYERTSTQKVNWEMAQVFKAAVLQGSVHAPGHDLARSELEFLVQTGDRVDHPTSGPVQTKDVADAMINVTYTLLAQRNPELYQRLGGTLLHASVPGPNAPVSVAPTPDVLQQLSDFTRNANRREIPHNPARGRRGRRSW